MKKFAGILGLVLGLFLISNAALAVGTIEGTVTKASDDTALEGAAIYATSISDNTDSEADTAAADGSYSMNVDAGSYIVYHSGTVDGEAYIRQIESVTVADGATETVSFSLNRRGKISGNIYQSDGATPLYYASVWMTHTSGSSYGYDGAYTPSNGSYTLYPDPTDQTLSAAGPYTFYVTKAGYYGARIENFILTDDDDLTQNFSLTAASTVSGTVTYNDAAVDEAIVTLEDDDYNTYTAITNSSGEYTITIYDMYDYNGSAIGDYTLTVTKDGYIAGTKDVEIETDESAVTGQNFSLSEAGSLTGTIQNKAQTKYLSGATITAEDGLGNTYTTATNSSGEYSLEDLPSSDTYTLTASKDKYLTKIKYDQAIYSGIESNVNFKLTKGKKLSGKVQSKSGTKLKDATVSLYKRDEHYSTTADYSTTTKNKGKFTINGIVPGNYRVKISKDGYVVKNIRKLKLKKNKTGKVYELNKSASITGRVTNSGDPVRGALIYAYGQKIRANEGYASTTTDSDGYYQIPNLKKGTYQIKVLSTDYVSKTVEKSLKKGQQKTVNFKVGLAGEISGYVIDKETNIPLSNYCVRVKGTSRYDCTDSGGYYIINGLKKGSYELFVASDAYQTLFYDSEVKVKADQTTEDINFYLTHKDNN